MLKKKAHSDQEKAKKDINSANIQFKQSQQDKLKNESTFSNLTQTINNSEAKINKLEKELNNFIKWNSEVDYGKKEWKSEVDGWLEQIEKHKKERDTAKKSLNSARDASIKSASRMEQARKNKSAAEMAFNDAKKTLDQLKARREIELKNKNEMKARAEAEQLENALKFAAAFNQELFKVYGQKAGELAKALEKQTRGKNIRNVDEALKAYNKYKGNIDSKINATDRLAIFNALESMDAKVAEQQFKMFSKSFGIAGHLLNVYDMTVELKLAIKNNNWRPFFVKAETIAVAYGTSSIAALAFSTIMGGPIGLLGYALIMAGIGALISDELVENANNIIGI